ncbi:hypothetical protein [Streptomyces sp. NPDC049555]|uniref:hypothetical protein n=1 Tax=Streptomyces sp. NPDC049555 TaxID=3154930 RepID=UPI003419372A
MRSRAGAALAGALPAALLCAVTAGPAPAAAEPADGVVVGGPGSAQRGEQVDFVVSVRDSLPGVDRVTLTSPVLVKDTVVVTRKHFGHNKADEYTIDIRDYVRCDLGLGTYEIRAAAGGTGHERTTSVAFTVTGTRDASARTFCAAPRAEQERLARAAQDALPDTTAGEPVTDDATPGVLGGTALTVGATFLVLLAVALTALHRYRRRPRP